uniref:Gypsy retrotransposon integrase-like protein 1 n=1 Tax=Oryzias latipes TaxID=8090 RepID=A0A3B3IN70_ORYLA
MWGSRVVVPHKFRPCVLQELHSAHPGVVKMKSLARSYVWWPNIDAQIESQVKSCHSCQQLQREPRLAPLHPWVWPSSPWERIHVDFAGPFEGHMYLIVVDAHSKWPEVQIMDSTTAGKTIQVLRSLFSRHGIPQILVSDNGPQFCSEEFDKFMRSNSIKHIRSAPYHPATNGLAERFVQTFKHALKSLRGMASVQQRLDTFLLTYRNTPHATTKEAPAMLFLKRRLRSRLDLIKPNVRGAVRVSQDSQLLRRQGHSREGQFGVGDPVLVRDYRRGEEKWTDGVVQEQTGPVSYQVKVGETGLWRRHADQMLSRSEPVNQEGQDSAVKSSFSQLQLPSSHTVGTPDHMVATDQGQDKNLGSTKTGLVDAPELPQAEGTPLKEHVRRYPLRKTKPPARYCV